MPVQKKARNFLTTVKNSNVKKDKQLQALPPGKRISKNGNVYYENRVNRADKGKLYGLENNNINFMILLENSETTLVSDLIKDINYCIKIIFKYEMLISRIKLNLKNCDANQKSKCLLLIKKFQNYCDECEEHAKEINKILNSPL